MNPVHDGGPAFPVVVDCTQPEGQQVGNTMYQVYGLTVRDYFAARVLPAIYEQHTTHANEYGWNVNWKRGIAVEAYELADEMLAARNQPSPSLGKDKKP